MADRRIYQLTPSSVISGYKLPIDKSGNAEALSIPIEYLVDGTHTRCNEQALTAGTTTIAFSSPVPSTAYVVLVNKHTNGDGDASGSLITNKTVNGFDVYVYEDGTFLYYTTKTI